MRNVTSFVRTLSLCAAITLSGCAARRGTLIPISDPIGDFRTKQPEKSAAYTVLREANVDRLFEIIRVESGNVALLMRKLKEQFPANTEVAAFADSATEGERKKVERIRRELKQLKAASKDGMLCEFERKADGEHVWGFLVLRNGDVVEEHIWAFAAAHLESN